MSVVDIGAGFGGFAREFLTHVREECPKAPIVVFGTTPARVLRDAAVVAPVSTLTSVGGSAMCVCQCMWGWMHNHTRGRSSCRTQRAEWRRQLQQREQCCVL